MALDMDDAKAEAILASFDAEERKELEAYESLAARLSRAGNEMAAVSAQPSKDAFRAQLDATPDSQRVRHRWRLPQLPRARVASRSLLAGGVVFLGLAAGVASAFSGDPLGLSRALPLLSTESTSDSAPFEADQDAPLIVPQQDDGPSAGQDIVAPGQGGENPGQGVGPDGTAPGQGGTNPGQGVGPDGTAPGQGGTNPGQGVGSDGTAPGQGGENPGQGVGPDGTAPGQGGTNPGQGVGPDGTAPGQGGTNPGQGVGPDGTAPGQGGTNPGQGVGSDGTAPGQGGSNPGNGHANNP